jgi:hypothetical protein
MNDDKNMADDNAQNPIYQADEDIPGEAGPSGDSPERVQDVDADAEDLGMPQDTPQGPTEVGIKED